MRELLDWLRSHWFSLEPWTLWLIGVSWAIRLALGVRLICSKRSVPVILSWMVLVFTLPIPGAIVYLLVGENRLGALRQRERQQMTSQIKPLLARRWGERGLIVQALTLGDRAAPVAKSSTAVGLVPPLRGNRLQLIASPDDYLTLLIRDIDAATSHCHLLYYIWMKGGRADEVAQALIRAARRGVECKLLVDDVGSRPFLRSAMVDTLREAGVRVQEALPAGVFRALLNRLDLRNHRKIAVIDGLVAYMGSQNLTDNTFHYRKARKLGPWIDASVRVEGPAVQALAMTFLTDWAVEVDEDVPIHEKYLPKEAEEAMLEPGGAIAQVVPTGPSPTSRAAMREAFLAAIYSATKELILSTPYFAPDEATDAALQAAARRGVVVTLILPRRSDHWIVDHAGRAHIEPMLDAGVRVFQFRHGLLHAKTMVVDGAIALIGSANLDMRSFWLNYEVALLAYDAPFAADLRHLQLDYIQNSHEVDADAWAKRDGWERLKEGVARLFGPLL